MAPTPAAPLTEEADRGTDLVGVSGARPGETRPEPGHEASQESGPRSVLDRLRSLSDETRARILLLLDGHELTAGEICQVMQIPQSTGSRHLGVLLNEGWVKVRVDGTSRHYRFSTELEPAGRQLWAAVRDELAGTGAAQEDRLRATSVLLARAERAKAFFATEASRWDHLKSRLFGEGADLQLLPALLEGHEAVADLGCGTGRLAGLLAPFAGSLVGVDRSPEMLALARTRLEELDNVELRQGNLEELPIDDGTMDVAILSLVLHYVPDPGRALAEAHRILRPGGRLLVLDIQEHDRAAFRAEMGHLWLGFSPDQMVGWMEAAGFVGSRRVAVPPHPEATGPLLFAVRGLRPADVGDARSRLPEQDRGTGRKRGREGGRHEGRAADRSDGRGGER